MATMESITKGLGSAITSFAAHTAQAAKNANATSFASQSAQGTFNQASANIANGIGDTRTAEQYEYNTAQWQMAADWNREMFERQMAFNAEEAKKQRDWQQMMDSTKYQRAIKDMETAGLNPIMAVTGGGISVGGGTGATASTSAPNMSSASGGLINGISASEGNFTGQMEYMSGILGLLSAAIGGISSAMGAFGQMGEFGRGLAETVSEAFTQNNIEENKKYFKETYERGKENQKNPNYKPNYRNGIDWNMKDYGNKSGYYG